MTLQTKYTTDKYSGEITATTTTDIERGQMRMGRLMIGLLIFVGVGWCITRAIQWVVDLVKGCPQVPVLQEAVEWFYWIVCALPLEVLSRIWRWLESGAGLFPYPNLNRALLGVIVLVGVLFLAAMASAAVRNYHASPTTVIKGQTVSRPKLRLLLPTLVLLPIVFLVSLRLLLGLVVWLFASNG